MKPFRGMVIFADFPVRTMEFGTIEDMQRIVGGYIEGIWFGCDRDAFAYVNEDGYALRLGINHTASRLLAARGIPLDRPIVGNMIVGGAVMDGEQQSIPPALERWIDLNSREG